MPTSRHFILKPMPEKSDRQGLAGRSLAFASATGGAVLLAALLGGAGWAVAVTSAWGAAALLIVSRIWLRIYRMDAAGTAAHAQAEDFSRATADLVVIGASLASLIAIGFTLAEARHQVGADKRMLIALAVAVVALSWATVQLIFTVRYGDLYYAPPVGGINFNERDPPDYRDFAYLAVTIGMTFQVSDTNLSSKAIRRAATRHALMSYVFGTVIVALAINTVASLLQ